MGATSAVRAIKLSAKLTPGTFRDGVSNRPMRPGGVAP
jgi:hypothetical protein